MFPLHDDNPIDSQPWVSYALLGLCIAVFLWQIGSGFGEVIIYALGVIPALLFGHAELDPQLAWVPPWVTIFSSMFLHGGWMHLISNMLYLWVFANNIEHAMGHVRFLIFYLLCGVAAVFAQALPDVNSQIPMIGASGAISGVLGAYFILYPHARVLVVVPIVFIIKSFRIPALFVLGFWFLMQLFSTLMSSGLISGSSGASEGGVAFGAHIGGFVAGIVLTPLFVRGRARILLPFVHYHPFRR